MRMTTSNCQLMAGDAAVSLEIAFAGGVNDAGWQRWWRRFAIPAACPALDVKVVAQRLLVETRLRLTGLVRVRRPEPRTVWRHHLVNQDDMAILIAAEFEFGVGDDDALAAADLFAKRIDRAGHALERICRFIAQDLAHPRDGDVLVMTGFGLGCRAEDRWIELGAFQQTSGKCFTGQGATLCVFLPRRTREVAADYAFNRKHRGAPAQHRASGERIAMPAQGGNFGNNLV